MSTATDWANAAQTQWNAVHPGESLHGFCERWIWYLTWVGVSLAYEPKSYISATAALNAIPGKLDMNKAPGRVAWFAVPGEPNGDNRYVLDNGNVLGPTGRNVTHIRDWGNGLVEHTVESYVATGCTLLGYSDHNGAVAMPVVTEPAPEPSPPSYTPGATVTVPHIGIYTTAARAAAHGSPDGWLPAGTYYVFNNPVDGMVCLTRDSSLHTPTGWANPADF